MGKNLPILWFGKSVDELKAILETDKNLSEKDKNKLQELIKEKEKNE